MTTLFNGPQEEVSNVFCNIQRETKKNVFFKQTAEYLNEAFGQSEVFVLHSIIVHIFPFWSGQHSFY